MDSSPLPVSERPVRSWLVLLAAGAVAVTVVGVWQVGAGNPLAGMAVNALAAADAAFVVYLVLRRRNGG